MLEQVTKQVNKLIDVINVEDLEHREAMTGELALITVSAEGVRRAELLNLVTLLGLTLVDIREDSLTVMVSGSDMSVDMAVSGLAPFGIRAMARTGLVALARPVGSILVQDKEDPWC
jgi:acetolactate synthase-1/3 small subunit